MQGYATTGEGFSGRTAERIEEWMDTVATELRQAVNYVDRVVVPEVRRESASGMRVLARHLERWAESLDPVRSDSAGNGER